MKLSFPKRYSAVLLFTLLLLFLSKAKAQKAEPLQLNQGEVVTLHSDILKEDRKIMIYVPKEEANPEKAYPVVYVLDAENHFSQMVEYSKFFGRPDVEVAPPLIIVGIKNTNRTRDLTPSQDTTGTSPSKNSGGNEQLFKFIEQELISYVERNYKTQPYRIFAGHSFGGITAINCLIQHPDMFNAYIAASPSFGWDQKYMLKLADERLKPGSTLSKTLFFSDGNEGEVYKNSGFHTNVLQFDSLLTQRSIKGLDFRSVHYPGEDHNTVPIKSYFDGLRFIFRQWEFIPASYEEDNLENIVKHYKELSQRFGYTILPEEVNINEWGEWLVSNPANLTYGIKLLEMNTVNYPTSSKAFASLGAAYAIKGDNQKAIAAYKKASKLNPKSKEISSHLQELQNTKATLLPSEIKQ